MLLLFLILSFDKNFQENSKDKNFWKLPENFLFPFFYNKWLLSKSILLAALHVEIVLSNVTTGKII